MIPLPMPLPDLGPVMPEIVMTCMALAVMLADLFIKRKEVVAGLTLVSALVVGYTLFAVGWGVTFDGMFLADGYGFFFKLVFLLNLALTVLISVRYLSVESAHYGEYYSLLLFATLGMMIMASAGDFISLYVGLELMALSTYVLAGFLRNNRKSNEAAIKYFLLGAFASAFLLYGISLSYGLTGTTSIKGTAAYIAEHGLASSPALMISMLFFCAAFSFKIAAVPFHMWAPDVYEGAPTSVTAFMSVGPKAAGFAALGRVFLVAFGSVQVDWVHVLVPIAVLTMAVGNIVALAQTNIKRMLAYSSIAHAGYALLGVIAGGPDGLSSMMNYMLVYAFMNIGAFAVIISLRRAGAGGESIFDYQGLSKTHPMHAAFMLIFMFSLTGIPPTAGFIGKVYLFMAAVNAGHVALVVLAVIFSAISAFFYLRIVMFMYMREPEPENVPQVAETPGLMIALGLCVAGVLVLGVLPANALAVAMLAAKGIF